MLSLEVRLAIVFTLSALIGGQINRGIYRLAWNSRNIGPWSDALAAAPSRSWLDRIPIIGWYGLRRESSLHGYGFWLRPMLLELAVSCGFTALYYWEMSGGLFPAGRAIVGPSVGTLHLHFLSHIVLISLMTIATFIDFDEKTIPDEITVPGVLLGLTFAAIAPTSLLPVLDALPGAAGRLTVSPIHAESPLPWPLAMNALKGLLIGYACFGAWCLALLPRIWTTRRGWRKACRYLFAGMGRYTNWTLMGAIFCGGMIGISLVWALGGLHWRSLYTSLFGLAFGGAMIWGVRIVGSRALAQEAMGFGDVTLMAMIGSFMGWQAALMTFFLAPFAAIFISVAKWIVTRRKDIAFGPYLCLGALCLIVYWNAVWNRFARQTFSLGGMIIWILLVCLVLMGVMLKIWVQIRDWLFFPEPIVPQPAEEVGEPLAAEVGKPEIADRRSSEEG